MSQQDLLRRLIFSAEKLKNDFPLPANLNSPTSTTLLLQKIPPLRLAKLDSIFRSDMTRNRISPRIYKMVLSKASELGASYQEYYVQTCRELLALPVYPDDPPIATFIDKLRSALEHRYDLKGLSQLMREALNAQVAHCNSCDEWPASAESKQRRSFNHKYTPLLEKYFEHNAYPSVPDRLVLARKSMMTPRQIEVWFQNHRNRAKKDGKVLKRWKSGPPALDISLEALNHRIPQFSIPENIRNEILDPDLSDDDDADSANEGQDTAQITNESNDFKFSAPSHAFPTKYPPSCVEDPFPNKDGVFKFCAPNWRRRPATTALQHKTLSIDELTAHFASKLNLREVGDKGYNAKNNHCNKRSQPWFAATVTIPCPAPHPALVKLPIRRTSAPPSPLTLVVPALQSQSSTPQSRTIVPASLSSSLIQSKCAPRKIACLPRRTPSNLISFGAAPSSPSSHASPTRTSSFSSVASSESSLSDNSPIDPITPPSSPNSGGVILSEETFPGYLQAQHQLDMISPRHMDSSAGDTIAKHIPFSQYEISSLLTIPHTHYLLAQS